MEKLLLKKLLVGTVFGVLLNSTTAIAGYGHEHELEHSDFTFFATPTAWDPGPDTARVGGFPAPGGATWSIMAAGLTDGSSLDPHGGVNTTDFSALVAAANGIWGAADINTVLDTWANASGFTNLGQVADGGVDFGAAGGGNIGDIRIGAISIDGAFSVLAHAYQPGTNSIFGGGGDIAGDIHMDDAETWSTNGTGFDIFTVMLHEFGHALGLGHSDVVGSVMEATYAGPRQTLHADDIAGIQAIYGAPVTVPLPGALFMFLSALSALGIFGRRRNSAISV